MIETPDTLLHVGVSKTGKTFALRREVERSSIGEARNSKGKPRLFFVTDRLAEWSDLTTRHARVESMADARAAFRDRHSIVILTPSRANKTGSEPQELGELVADFALDNGVTVVMPEAHLYAPKIGKIEPKLKELVTAFRHYGAGLWADTQRFAAINEAIISQAEVIRLFGQRSLRDLARVRDEGGDELEEMVREALRRTFKEPREPGWFVEVGNSADFRLERFRG